MAFCATVASEPRPDPVYTPSSVAYVLPPVKYCPPFVPLVSISTLAFSGAVHCHHKECPPAPDPPGIAGVPASSANGVSTLFDRVNGSRPARTVRFPNSALGAVFGADVSEFARSNRPPVCALPARPGTGSAPLRIRLMVSRYVSPGNCALSSATAPVTKGAASEVPLSYA